MFAIKKKPFIRSEENPAYWVEGQLILNQAHTLIAGSTGCGKSTFMHKLMWTALARTPQQTQFIMIDMKMGMELGKYRFCPHVLRFARTADEASSALDYAIEIMTTRANMMWENGQTMWGGSDVYVVIDELAFLLQALGQEAVQKITHISQIGRACRVHLILATQNPSKTGIPASIQQNMTCLVGMHCRDAIQSRQIIGASGCEQLPEHGMVLVVINSKTLTMGITPKSEAEYQKRINYWSNPANYVCYR